jgi:hypothetical protein
MVSGLATTRPEWRGLFPLGAAIWGKMPAIFEIKILDEG